MSNSTKAAFWQKHVTDWPQSGLSQKAYCAQHNLKLATFGYWRRRLAIPTNKKLIPVAFHRPTEATIILTAGGMRMEVPLSALEPVLSIVRRRQAAA